MTLCAIAIKLRWKTSLNGNQRLSFYGLTVTVFPNKRGGWSACVKPGDAPLIYLNYATEGAARAAAEQEFIRLKASGQFRPPPTPAPTVREFLRGINSLEELAPEVRKDFIELRCNLEREGDRANLVRIYDGNGCSESYWVPHSQHKVVRSHDYGPQTIIATKWWWDRAEPARGGW